VERTAGSQRAKQQHRRSSYEVVVAVAQSHGFESNYSSSSSARHSEEMPSTHMFFGSLQEPNGAQQAERADTAPTVLQAPVQDFLYDSDTQDLLTVTSLPAWCLPSNWKKVPPQRRSHPRTHLVQILLRIP
jgi:hypothetical protein